MDADSRITESVTGNIYEERFYDNGKHYLSYYADCALCGDEIVIFLSTSTGKRCKTYLKNKGWVIHDSGKWICPKCKSEMELTK